MSLPLSGTDAIRTTLVQQPCGYWYRGTKGPAANRAKVMRPGGFPNFRLCRNLLVYEGQPNLIVVEDNLLIAMEVASLAERCGCAVVGTAGTVREALALAEAGQLDGAILNINMGGQQVWPVAELLQAQGVPFVFITGYERPQIPGPFRNTTILSKPLTFNALDSALKEAGLTRS